MMFPRKTRSPIVVRQQEELNVHIEVLHSYWNRCLKTSPDKICDSSEVSCYVELIGKLLQKQEFISKSVTGEPFHSLFEAAVQMKLFELMHQRLEQFNGSDPEMLKAAYLDFYESLIGSPFFCLLIKEEFLLPLMCTLRLCSRYSSLRIENNLLQTLHTLCIALHQQSQLSSSESSFPGANRNDLLWSICLNPLSHLQKSHSLSPDDGFSSASQSSNACISTPNVFSGVHNLSNSVLSICDLLVPYVHRDGSLSWLSRDALLLLVASSTTNDVAGSYMSQNSNLSEVLVTDLVLLFNDMPRRLVQQNDPEQWPNLLRHLDALMENNQLVYKFLDHFEFCCSIVDISNYLVKETMLSCLYRGFLKPVLAPWLLGTTDLDLATVTIYLEQILKKSKNSTLLPFILQFLCSDRETTTTEAFGSSPAWPWANVESLCQVVTSALEQSFPFADTSFYRGQASRLPNNRPKSYMDVLLKRIHNCNTLVGIATLSLMNTIFDLMCEDITFELVLKYLLPLGQQPSLKPLVTNPDAFLTSAGQYLALIPPYSSSATPAPRTPPKARRSHAKVVDSQAQNGDLSCLHVDEAFVADLDIIREGKQQPTHRLPHPMDSYLREARTLLREQKGACVHWRFPYDLDNPAASLASESRISDSVLMGLPLEGPSASKPEVDDLAEDSIIEDLDKFSALLRASQNSTPVTQPPPPHYRRRQAVAKPATEKRRKNRGIADDIKRTSSLYDISFTYLELEDDKNSESEEGFAPPERMTQSFYATPQRRVASLTASDSSELSLTESVADLATGVQHLSEGNVSGLLTYLDKLPAVANQVEGGKDNQQDSEEQLISRINEAATAAAKHSAEVGQHQNHDSGITSVESGVLKEAAEGNPPFSPTSRSLSTLPGNNGICSQADAKAVNLGPFVSTLMQLVSRIPLNHLYANLLITRLASRLVALPLPLVRVLLLLTNQADQPRPSCSGHARSHLYATLLTVRQWFDCYINLHFSEVLSGHCDVTFTNLVTVARETITPGSQDSRLGGLETNWLSTESSRKTSMFDRFRRTPQKTQSPVTVVQSPKSPDWRRRTAGRLGNQDSIAAFKAIKDDKSRGVIVSLLVFEEFCQELAAICMEHSISL